MNIIFLKLCVKGFFCGTNIYMRSFKLLSGVELPNAKIVYSGHTRLGIFQATGDSDKVISINDISEVRPGNNSDTFNKIKIWKSPKKN